MRPLIYLFTPIFFVTVGLSMNLKVIDFSSFDFWSLTFLLLLIAVIGKLGGAFLLRRMDAIKKFIIGVSMIPRGEVGLIFAELGRTVDVFSNEVYASLVFVIIITTVVPPFLLKWLFEREESGG